MSAAIWAGWVLYFAVFEGHALLKHRTDETFSFQVWKLEHDHPAFKVGLAGLGIWLAFHFNLV